MNDHTPLRGLSVLRLSVLTDETTSPERQRAANEEAARALGIELSPEREAVDLGVSASKTTPFERPELGAWLERPADWDALVCWRFDRLVRSMADVFALAEWAKAHRKMIVFAEGPGGRLVLDFRNPLDPITHLLVMVFAFAAEMEAQAIRERVNGAQAAMRTMELRWRGARPPYGYMPQELETGGWTLVQDPKAVKVIERIMRDLFAGKTASTVSTELNAEGVPSPRDHWSLRQGRKTGGKTGATKGKNVSREKFSWRPAMLSRLMRSYALLGWKTHDGNPVRDSNGAPVMSTTEPILTREEFDAIGSLLDSRKTKQTPRKDSKALLLGVIFCASCGGRVYADLQKGTYKCGYSSRGQQCERPVNVRMDWAESRVEEKFLAAVGGLRVTEIKVTAGYDPAPEIAATLAEYEEHQKQEGRQRSQAARDAWQRRADALDSRLAELESREKVEPKREVVATDRTYADEWASAGVTARRDMLTDAGARFVVNRLEPKKPAHRSRFTINADFYSDAAAELAAIAEVELSA
ncbi:recombinase family protein [Streptomyces sp. NPDC057376]|uniref:recombinase family protein n=1 Tax=unclassified Streptomyces TaxID=2593676 RepID=UPI00095AB313|nr:recombinase family protein [Streptomyces sp. CB02414]OKI87217.1 integrase [Streptomyces sp. CB02414]